MEQFKKVCLLCLAVIITACGAALTLKAAIGVGAWDALAQTGGEIFKIKVGTVGMICNFICVLLQIIILKKNFKLIQLLQIPVSILLGMIINLMLYQVYSNITITSYWMNIILLIIGYIITAGSVAVIMVMDIVTFALEGLCMAIHEVTKIKFHHLRQGVDVICILVILFVSLSMNIELSIREGTVIGMLLYGPLMGIFMRVYVQKLKNR